MGLGERKKVIHISQPGTKCQVVRFGIISLRNRLKVPHGQIPVGISEAFIFLALRVRVVVEGAATSCSNFQE